MWHSLFAGLYMYWWLLFLFYLSHLFLCVRLPWWNLHEWEMFPPKLGLIFWFKLYPLFVRLHQFMAKSRNGLQLLSEAIALITTLRGLNTSTGGMDDEACIQTLFLCWLTYLSLVVFISLLLGSFHSFLSSKTSRPGLAPNSAGQGVLIDHTRHLLLNTNPAILWFGFSFLIFF